MRSPKLRSKLRPKTVRPAAKAPPPRGGGEGAAAERFVNVTELTSGEKSGHLTGEKSGHLPGTQCFDTKTEKDKVRALVVISPGKSGHVL